MSSVRHNEDAVSIFEPNVGSLPAPPLSSMNRSVRWKYENSSTTVHQEPNRAKFMNKVFGGVSSKTPANSFRIVHSPSQDDASTIESSVVLHMVDTSHIRDELRLRLFSNESRDAPHLTELPPPPSAITKTRQISPKIPERRKFFMDKLFTVSRLHVNEAGMPLSPGKTTIPRRNPITCAIDGDSTTTDANSSVEESGETAVLEKPWMRTPTIISPVEEQQNWYSPPALEEDRVFVPAKIPPLLPLKRPKEEKDEEEEVQAPSLAPRRWKLYWDDWVHTATSLQCIASCSAADFRCDDTSEFRSQMGEEDEDFVSMNSLYSLEEGTSRGPYSAFGGGGDDSLISSNAFENDTWDERNMSSDHWSGWSSPASTGDDTTTFSSQNSAWL